MSAARGRRWTARWTARLLLGGALAAAGFLVASLRSELGDRAAPEPAVIALSSERGLAAPSAARPALAVSPDPAMAQPAAPGEPAPGLAPAPVLHPRDEGEWQGMRVNTAAQALCDTSSRCGLGMACHEGTCGPCAADDECAAGEACVLDHCVPAAQVECRSRRDCAGAAEDQLCVLSGYSPDPRGNASMMARCQATQGGAPAAGAEPVAVVSAPAAGGAPAAASAPASESAPQALLESVRAHARAAL